MISHYLKLLLMSLFFLTGCSITPPDDIPVVEHFDVSRYQGHWYEIARLDHRFERNMQQVSATYSLRDDGGIKVINRGFDTSKQTWREAEGKAYFIGSPSVGALKVSFFGPFYGGYNVIALDDDYQYALVSGPDRDYLWILARTPTIPDNIKQAYLAIAQHYGFDTNALIWPIQSKTQ